MESANALRTANYATICRLCLEPDGVMLAIFKTTDAAMDEADVDSVIGPASPPYNIYRKIKECLQIQIAVDDGLPPNICHRCLYKVELCISFKRSCLQSDATLRNKIILNNTEEENEDHLVSPEAVHRIVNHLKFEEFTLRNHKFLTHEENIENVITVVDPNVDYDSDNEEEVTEPERDGDGEVDHHSDLEYENLNEMNELKNVFMCQYCDRAFTNEDSCYLHEQTNHDLDTPFLCQECDMTFADRINFTAHLKSVHRNDKPFGCPECDRSFGRRSDLRKHTIVHTGIKPFTCPLCLKSFSRNTNLTKHLRIHSGHKPHVCPQCPRTFISKGDLSRHALIHSGVKPFACRHCDQTFGRKDKLIRHEKRHTTADTIEHTSDAADDMDLLQEKYLQDQFSSYEPLDGDIKQEVDSDQWDNSENMVISLDPYNHSDDMEVESSERSFPPIPDHIEREVTQIPVEIEKFSESPLEQLEQLQTLPDHITGDDVGFQGFSAEEVKKAKSALLRKWRCTTCGKRFTNGDDIRQHMVLHNGIRPHICTVCSKTFTRKRELDRHMATHTGMKPFECTTCDKKFGRKDKLVRHMRVHDISKHLTCTYCAATFTRKDGLAHHIKTHINMLKGGLSLSVDGESLTLNTNTNHA